MSLQNTYRFTAAERLKPRSLIDLVYTNGSKFRSVQLAARVYTQPTETKQLPKVVIMVPKRLVSKAHNRNRIKRHIRESYRLHKGIIANANNNNGNALFIAWIWHSKQQSEWNNVQKEMKEIMAEMAKAGIC